MPTLADIEEHKKYRYNRADSVSGLSHRSGATSLATSTATSATKVRKFLNEAFTTLQRVNSQFASAGEEYSADELRKEIRSIAQATTSVALRADEYSLRTLEAFLKEVDCFKAFVAHLNDEKQSQLQYDLSSLEHQVSIISDVVNSKTATASVAGSTATYHARTAEATNQRLTGLEEQLEKLVTVIGESIKAKPRRVTSNPSEEGDRLTNENSYESPVEEIHVTRMSRPQGDNSSRDAALGSLQHAVTAGTLYGVQQGLVPYNPQASQLQPNGSWTPQQHPHMHAMVPQHVHQSPCSAYQGAIPVNGQHMPHITINTNVQSDANAQADAEQHSSTIANLASSVKAKLRAACNNPMLTALAGMVAMALLHNRLPVIKNVGASAEARRMREEVDRSRADAKRAQAASWDAVEDCHDVMREWREYARRSKGPFNHVPEPDTSRCDLRQIRRRLERTLKERTDT